VRYVVAIGFVCVLTSGCASYIETVRINPNTLQVEGEGVKGVIYYPPRLVKIRYELTQLVDDKKGLVGTSEDGSCRRTIQKEEITTLPDYSKPMAILHKPSWFASSDFGVTLSNGMLVSVTSKSTPQLPDVLEQVAALKGAGVLGVAPNPACNAGPIITSITPAT